MTDLADGDGLTVVDILVNAFDRDNSEPNYPAFVRLCQETAAKIAALAAPGGEGAVALSASDRACYEYPGVDQGKERDAFVAGAEAYCDASMMHMARCAEFRALEAESEPVAWRPDRESVARVIDPLAWGLHDDVSAEEAAFIGISTEMSLTKADRILALTAPSPKGCA